MSEPKFSPGPWEAHTSYDELWGDDVWYQTEYHSVRDMAEWLEKMRGMKDTALVRVMFQRADDIEKLLSKARGEK